MSNKSDLIEAIAKSADISKAAAGRALDATIESIKKSLKKGELVSLVGFGTFYVGKRAARNGRNPRTGVEAVIIARRVVTFKASPSLIAITPKTPALRTRSTRCAACRAK